MRILALETAVQPGSIALLEKSHGVSQADLAADTRTTRSLMPAIQGQLEACGWKPGDLGLVAVSRGPGSFTGLRVGITVAKTLAYAVGAEVLGIDTLDVIARQSTPSDLPPGPRSLWAVMDAQRRQLFCAKYDRDGADGWQRVRPPQVLDIDVWLEQIAAGDVVTGPPVEKLRARLHPQAICADAADFAPRAATVGSMAIELFEQGRRDDLWGLVPAYHRQSAAEEKRAARLESP